MSAPLNRMTKKEILWLHNHRCKHYKTFVEHYSCYKKEGNVKEKVGYFDIEAYGYGKPFKATNSLIFCYCIKQQDSDTIITGINTRQEILSLSDKEIMIKMIADLRKFDKILGYYSTRYDLPFIRTRALANKLKFIEYGELLHRDVFYSVRSKLLLERSTQTNAGRLIRGKSNKTQFSPKVCAQAFQGNDECLLKIVDHCERDVIELECIHNEMKKYKKR